MHNPLIREKTVTGDRFELAFSDWDTAQEFIQKYNLEPTTTLNEYTFKSGNKTLTVKVTVSYSEVISVCLDIYRMVKQDKTNGDHLDELMEVAETIYEDCLNPTEDEPKEESDDE